MARHRSRALLCLIAFFSSTPALATILSDWTVEQVARRADSIVVGVVVSQSTLFGPQLRTETEIKVEQTLWGPAVERLVVTQLGGRVGERVVEVVGDAQLMSGQRFVLFTRLHSDGRRYLVGMALGAYLVDGQEARQQLEVPLLTAGGQMAPPPGMRSLPIATLLQRIAEARR